MKRENFPFAALLGQEAMQAALLVNAVDPTIGGVLVRGQKGTGKSTAARALAGLLPPIQTVQDCPYRCPPDQPAEMHDGCRQRRADGEDLPVATLPTPFVELPLSAGEDRLIGTLHLARTLETGERHFEPGLLAAANRGILYVDEVNLLPDHLVDMLLDAAASGVNVVEREGMRLVHPARFLLVGTMNPEEGELRPQFLDRFGLCVDVTGINEPDQRRRIVQRRLAFDQNPAAFRKSWQEQENRLAAGIATARKRLRTIAIPEELLTLAVELAVAAGVQGHRADLALIRTARALAALLDRGAIAEDDLAEAATLVLPHRLADPQAGPGPEAAAVIRNLLDEHLSAAAGSKATPLAETGIYGLDDGLEFPGAAAAGVRLFAHLKKKPPTGPSKRRKPST
ncbi:MAG TPA: ATP-binding protein [Desulfuromonadales bacterium]|nr:ATP-binding protein [Desulfuromonadales bacterium]